MKISLSSKTSFISLMVASNALVSSVAAIPNLLARQADSCPVDAISCSTSDADSCCTPTYGLMVHVQQWLPDYGPATAFTMHGLWPDTCSGGIPGSGNSGCDASRNYDDVGEIIQSADSSLYSQLNIYWPSYTGDNGAFWTHEWNKHGTCVTTLDPECFGSSYEEYDDITAYFQKTLDLRAEYDLYQILKSAGITPGSSYSVSAFESAIEKSTGATPKITCSGGALEEIWLYFYVKGTDTYVPTDAFDGTSCSGSIQYPAKN
ncbi:RNase Sy [Fennellomyces sp. T-0311]|nr:RNase Sy [Fennellomyces sp. T-0311]